MIRFRHARLEPQAVVDGSLRLVEQLPRLGALIEQFQKRELSSWESIAFARRACLFRYPSLNAAPVDIQTLLKQNPQFLLNTALSGAAAQIQKELIGSGHMIPTSSLSFVGADQYIVAAGPASAGVSIAQVVPSPTSAMPAVRECAQALQAAGIKTPMNSTQLEACFGARVLAEGIRRARKPVTRQGVVESLANLGSYDLGGYKITFANGAQHGSKFVDLAMVTRDGKLTTR